MARGDPGPLLRACAAACFVASGALSGAACTSFDDATSSPSYLSLEDAVRVCSLVSQCDGLADAIVRSIGVAADEGNFSQCMTWLGGAVPAARIGLAEQQALLACAARAAAGAAEIGPDQCGAAMDCAYIQRLTDVEACAPGAASHCEDGEVPGSNRFVVDREACVRLDCGSPLFSDGPTPSECVEVAGGKKLCGRPLEPGQCPLAIEARVTCEGDTLSVCAPPAPPLSAVDLRLGCAVAGGACAAGAAAAEARLACLAPGTTCDPCTPADTCGAPGPPECESEAVARVCGGRSWSRFDCAAMDLGCKNDGGFARCGHPDDECSPTDEVLNSCFGDTISFCWSGTATTFDCATIGMTCRTSAARGKTASCG
jgi:hypothetical protein